MDNEKTIAILQKKEDKIWEFLEKKCTKEVQDKVAELIEINLELESLSNL